MYLREDYVVISIDITISMVTQLRANDDSDEGNGKGKDVAAAIVDVVPDEVHSPRSESLYNRNDCQAGYEHRGQTLNAEQRAIWDLVRPAIDNSQPLAVCIDGAVGTVKMFLYNLILAYTRSKGYIALAAATSGVAALLLQGGCTAHSRLKLPLDAGGPTSTCNNSKQSVLAQ